MLWLAWILYLTGHVGNHLRVRWSRRGGPREKRVRTERLSDAGLALQLAAVATALLVRRSGESPEWFGPVGLAMSYGGVALTWLSLAWLGRHWRAGAVVTEDHELVTGGPYGVVRHPVYTALLAMVLGSALLVARWWAGLLAVAVYVAGTELRIMVEDRLLLEHFGERFKRYQERTAAWLPPVR